MFKMIHNVAPRPPGGCLVCPGSVVPVGLDHLLGITSSYCPGSVVPVGLHHLLGLT